MADAPETKERELTIIRVFDAPRELVFRAWTDPDQFGRWLGPKGFTAPSVTLNLQVGGRWRTCIRDESEGVEFWAHGVYREIEEPERLVFTYEWEDAAQSGLQTLVTISFADLGAKTEMTFHQAVFDTVDSRDGHQDGWSQSFDDLAGFLARRTTFE
jgi:uncharacterized protein YndB with AHSA1/START domain